MDLFGYVSRDERQEQCRVTWIKNKCRGSIQACTGFGKTRVGLNCIKTLLSKRPGSRVLIVVPTDVLQIQWQNILDSNSLSFYCTVAVINTVVKHSWQCDLLILDEEHRYAADTFKKVFSKVQYKMILGLTATFERLDGREEIIAKYCPVIDKITVQEALLNGWVSKFKEYLVLIDVDNIDEYKQLNKEFTSHFEFFNFDFDLAMKMIGKDGYKYRIAYRDQLLPDNALEEDRINMFKNITIHAMGFMRAMQDRKTFINNHLKKTEIANMIIQARPNSKIITFSNNIKMAESIAVGEVYSGKTSKKKGRTTISEFNLKPTGVLNTVKKAIEGLDVKGLSVAINIGIDSSEIKAVQKLGRIIRAEEGKEAEMFNIIINNTAEVEWFKKSHKNAEYITIDEENLKKVLLGKEYNEYRKPIPKLSFRF
jgi:superfamily II DNA or RNA helicase